MADDLSTELNGRRPWPELERAIVFDKVIDTILNEIKSAPTEVRKALAVEIASLKGHEFLSPYNAWGSVLDVLHKYHPRLGAEVTHVVSELAGYDCDNLPSP